MIRVNSGLVELNGESSLILSELNTAIIAIKDYVSKEIGAEKANELISKSYNLAMMSESERDAYISNAMRKFERGLTSTLMKAILFDN